MESILTWLSTWTTDEVLTTWAKDHFILCSFLLAAAWTIAGRTKTTIDNEFLGRLKKRFSVGKSDD